MPYQDTICTEVLTRPMCKWPIWMNDRPSKKKNRLWLQRVGPVFNGISLQITAIRSISAPQMKHVPKESELASEMVKNHKSLVFRQLH